VHGLSLGPLEDAVQLEGHIGKGLADAVVQLSGDAGAFLGGADGAQTREPTSVVNCEGGRLHETFDQARLPRPEMTLVGVLEHEHTNQLVTRPQRRVHP
jgi:hypothetical protein